MAKNERATGVALLLANGFLLAAFNLSLVDVAAVADFFFGRCEFVHHNASGHGGTKSEPGSRIVWHMRGTRASRQHALKSPAS